VSPAKYELGFISQKTTFFIFTAEKPQILHTLPMYLAYLVTCHLLAVPSTLLHSLFLRSASKTRIPPPIRPNN
jgi:hypothetical protein